jgi:hypothetical protein
MSQADDEAVLADFLSHGEAVIHAPDSKVWAAVLNPSDWHGTLMAHVSGPQHEALVGYDVFTRYPFPAEMTHEQIRDLSRRGNEEGLRRLKSFVEPGVRP